MVSESKEFWYEFVSCDVWSWKIDRLLYPALVVFFWLSEIKKKEFSVLVYAQLLCSISHCRDSCDSSMSSVD